MQILPSRRLEFNNDNSIKFKLSQKILSAIIELKILTLLPTLPRKDKGSNKTIFKQLNHIFRQRILLTRKSDSDYRCRNIL